MFLQVRLNSRRLDRKALLPLKGGNVLQHTLRALRAVPADVHALLTDPSSAPAFDGFAREQGFALFVGPEEDVLGRFCRAVPFFRVTRVVRATGDNPLVSARQAAAILNAHREGNWQLSHFLDSPLGTGVEVVEASALLEADRSSSELFEHEHLTTYLYRHPERFRVGEVPCPQQWRYPRGRVTLDTPEDYELICRIFRELYRGQPIETEELIEWLKAHAEAGRQ